MLKDKMTFENSLEEFRILHGFILIDVYFTEASCSDGTVSDVLIFKFANKKNVCIDVTIIDGEWKIEESYAVDDEYIPLKSNEGTV